jgi:hypothetical protein
MKNLLVMNLSIETNSIPKFIGLKVKTEPKRLEKKYLILEARSNQRS